MCHSASSYNDFIHYSANGFTSPTHKHPMCMPVICHSSPLTSRSYAKSLGRVPAVWSTSSHPSSPLQVWLFEVISASGPTPLKCWVCLVWVHPSGLPLLAIVKYGGHVTKSSSTTPGTESVPRQTLPDTALLISSQSFLGFNTLAVWLKALIFGAEFPE